MPRLQKFDPRAQIGYLVGFEGTNIFRAWIPSFKRVVRSRDVRIDETQRYQPELDSQLEDSERQEVPVEESEPFTSVDAPSFKRIFHDLPGIELPLKSASTVKRRLVPRFEECPENLKRDLESTCITIGLSLDVWTSKNNLSILGVVGHWLAPEFVYKERVLEFKELNGLHSGENLAMVVGDLLEELNLNAKLLTITGDNASKTRL
ncbi:hypothetical protein V1509DRAFT_643652 [Lipomyces kononenkoae]